MLWYVGVISLFECRWFGIWKWIDLQDLNEHSASSAERWYLYWSALSAGAHLQKRMTSACELRLFLDAAVERWTSSLWIRHVLHTNLKLWRCVEIKNRMQSFANELCLPTEPVQDAPFLPDHDTLTCYQWTCLPVEPSTQMFSGALCNFPRLLLLVSELACDSD